jgi:hypothetical protein
MVEVHLGAERMNEKADFGRLAERTTMVCMRGQFSHKFPAIAMDGVALPSSQCDMGVFAD